MIRLSELPKGTSRISLAQYQEIVGKPVKTHRKSPEEDLHIACMEWSQLQINRYPALRWLVHVPNGGARSKAEAGRLKAMGVKKGYPDLVINKRAGQWAGLAIELKSDKGVASSEQLEWLEMFSSEGYLVAICKSLDAFIQTTTIYLSGESMKEIPVIDCRPLSVKKFLIT